MKIFISYSHYDVEAANRIVKILKDHGHDVWIDRLNVQFGDNIVRKISEALKDADIIMALISKNSLGSEWVNLELSAIGLREIASQKQRIIPVLLDKVSVPSYLLDYQYLDLTSDFDGGIDRLIESLNTSSDDEYQDKRKKLEQKEENYDSHIARLQAELRNGRLTLICGAGVSIDAGIPSWSGLLSKLLESMMHRISESYALDLSEISSDDFQQRYGSSSLIIGKYLKSNLGKDFLKELRDALYLNNPKSCEMINAIVDLARPQRDGKPLDSIITFNFDALIEENLDKSNILNRAIYSEAVNYDPHELPVYHVHGYLPRYGEIPSDTEIVFSEDAYHSQFLEPFSWSNLTQLNKLSQNTCLLVGLSLTDPNLRRLLDVSQRKNSDKSLTHFIIKRTPNFSPKNDVINNLGRLLEEQDAIALGLNVIWVKNYNEIPTILRQVAKV